MINTSGYRIYVHQFSDNGPVVTEVARVFEMALLKPVTRAIVNREGATHTVFVINSIGAFEGAWLGLQQQAGDNHDERESETGGD